VRTGLKAAGAFALTAAASVPASAAAQAWLPQQGDVFLAMSYGNAYNNGHVLADGTNNTLLGNVRGQSVLFDVGYTPLERLALAANVLYISTKWENTDPSRYRNHGPLDDGRYHSTWQDARIQARYALLDDPVVVTPLLGVLVPTHGYETQGHTAPGHGFIEVPVGLFVGRLLDPLVPGAHVQARYTYSFVERFHGYNLDHHDIGVEVGYALSARFNARAFANFHRTRGGIQANDITPSTRPVLFPIHDRASRSQSDQGGASVAFAASEALEVFVAGFRTFGGKDSTLTNAFTIGMSYSFTATPSKFRCKCS
jgi:hypothetical protein